MKKVLFFAAALFVTVAFTSCKKDWTCSCSFSIAGMPDVDNPILDAKKADAKDACDQLDATAKLVDTGAKCELK